MNVTAKAFTLIELLIVVAIIAILAAIAVPNFLEAQARAKVSRVMADMRSIGVALESYQTDYNNYPIEKGPIFIGYLMILGGRSTENVYTGQSKHAGILLTTPLAYLTAVPIDVYMTSMHLRSDHRVRGSDRQFSVIATMRKPGVYNRQLQIWFEEMRVIAGMFPQSVNWSLESCGPDLTWWHGFSGGSETARDPNRFIYDPTNGPVSQGQLVFSSQGWISPKK